MNETEEDRGSVGRMGEKEIDMRGRDRGRI